MPNTLDEIHAFLKRNMMIEVRNLMIEYKLKCACGAETVAKAEHDAPWIPSAYVCPKCSVAGSMTITYKPANN